MMGKTSSLERLEHQLRDDVRRDTALQKFNHDLSRAIQSHRRLSLKSDLLDRSYVRSAREPEERANRPGRLVHNQSNPGHFGADDGVGCLDRTPNNQLDSERPTG